jgi:hypothetical protein
LFVLGWFETIQMRYVAIAWSAAMFGFSSVALIVRLRGGRIYPPHFSASGGRRSRMQAPVSSMPGGNHAPPRCPSDLSDAEWAILGPLLSSTEKRDRPPKWPL